MHKNINQYLDIMTPVDTAGIITKYIGPLNINEANDHLLKNAESYSVENVDKGDTEEIFGTYWIYPTGRARNGSICLLNTFAHKIACLIYPTENNVKHIVEFFEMIGKEQGWVKLTELLGCKDVETDQIIGEEECKRLGYDKEAGFSNYIEEIVNNNDNFLKEFVKKFSNNSIEAYVLENINKYFWNMDRIGSIITDFSKDMKDCIAMELAGYIKNVNLSNAKINTENITAELRKIDLHTGNYNPDICKLFTYQVKSFGCKLDEFEFEKYEDEDLDYDCVDIMHKEYEIYKNISNNMYFIEKFL